MRELGDERVEEEALGFDRRLYAHEQVQVRAQCSNMGCPQARLRNGPLRPTSGLGHLWSNSNIQTDIRFPSASVRVTAALTGVQGDTPDAFRGTPDSL